MYYFAAELQLLKAFDASHCYLQIDVRYMLINKKKLIIHDLLVSTLLNLKIKIYHQFKNKKTVHVHSAFLLEYHWNNNYICNYLIFILSILTSF